MLERQIESKLRTYCKTKNVLFLKFTSPSYRGVPDRILFAPRHGACAFLEVKRKGKQPTELQTRVLKELSGRGCFAGYVDNYEDGVKFINNFLAYSTLI